MHACTMARGARAMQCAYCKAFQPSGEVCPDGWWYCDACWDWWQRWLDDDTCHTNDWWCCDAMLAVALLAGAMLAGARMF